MKVSALVNAASGIVFPSPCGVLVLKFYETYTAYDENDDRFRPLAGFWFLNPRRARPYGVWIKMPFCGAEMLWEQKAAPVCLKNCCVPRPVSRGADSSPVHGFLRKISRENTAGQSPRRIHIIYCALIESSMNLLPSLAFWRTSSVMSAPASTMTTPLSILMVRVAFLPRRKRR